MTDDGCASWERVPEDIRPTLKLYCDTLSRRVAAGEGLIISGAIGAGKTKCLALIEQAALAAGISKCYIRTTSLFQEFHFGKYERLDRTADLLMIDDLGTEYRSELPMSLFVDLINERWHYRRSVVVATNLTKDEIGADVALERVVSRLLNRAPWLWTALGDQRRPVSVAEWAAEWEDEKEAPGVAEVFPS